MRRVEIEPGRAIYRVSRLDWPGIFYQVALRLALASVLSLALAIGIVEGYL